MTIERPGASADKRLWVAVTGKGGSGKSVIAGTLARVLARRGRRVLALDSDPMPGLAMSLGAREPAEPPLNEAVLREPNRRPRFAPGVGPVRAAQRFATDAPDGVRLLTLGKVGSDGLAPVQSSVIAFHEIANNLHRSRSFDRWALVGDVPAGPRQVGAGFAAYARTYLIVSEPTWQGALTARRVARVARLRSPGADILFVGGKLSGDADRAHLEHLLDEPLFAAVPFDPMIAASERSGTAPLDAAPDSALVRAVEELAAKLEGT